MQSNHQVVKQVKTKPPKQGMQPVRGKQWKREDKSSKHWEGK